MKKNLTALLLFLLLCQFGISQSRENKGLPDNEAFKSFSGSKLLFGFKIGPTIPIGEFGEIDVNNEKAGLAKAGIQLNANLQYLFTESFYLLIEGGYSSNPVDEDELLLPLTNAVPAFVRVSATSKNWNGKTLNAAVGTRTAIDAKTYFLTKFGLGVQNLSAPSFTITLTDGRTTEILSQSSSTTNSLNFIVGASIVAEINQTTFFNIGIDYLRAAHEFKNIAVNYSINGASSGPTEFFEYDQNVEMIGITIGLSFKI
ncbi:MAG: hypothetical protein ACJAV5_001283 [Vicingaceae bacterium]|jgi:hypothetical protein